MELTPTQLAQYERDGFLIFPDLFNQGEIAVLRQEVARLSHLEAEEVVREYTGGVKSIFRVHEEDGATRSPPFCRDHVPAFPQRSPPSLLTTAARGCLRPAPDCRPRRALLHLSYSSAPLYADGTFVTHDPERTQVSEPS
jgi:hypothetical protein